MIIERHCRAHLHIANIELNRTIVLWSATCRFYQTAVLWRWNSADKKTSAKDQDKHRDPTTSTMAGWERGVAHRQRAWSIIHPVLLQSITLHVLYIIWPATCHASLSSYSDLLESKKLPALLMAVTWARQQMHRRERTPTKAHRTTEAGTDTSMMCGCCQFHQSSHTGKKGEDAYTLVIIINLHYYGSLKSTDACLGFCVFQTNLASNDGTILVLLAALALWLHECWSVHHSGSDWNIVKYLSAFHSILYKQLWVPEDETCWWRWFPDFLLAPQQGWHFFVVF